MKIITPRGIRSNNPGNIEYPKVGKNGKLSRTLYVGESKGEDSRFSYFDTIVNGVRAVYMNLLHGIFNHHTDSIWEMISVWAPKGENDVTAYVVHVCRLTGLSAMQTIEPTINMLGPIVHAICVHENGGEFVLPAVFKDAWDSIDIKGLYKKYNYKEIV